MYTRMKVGDIVRHFKWETLTEEQKKVNEYLYCIRGYAWDAETFEKVVIYQALYKPFHTYTRPAKMFFSEVDHKKYPDIKQKYRFEVYKGEEK